MICRCLRHLSAAIWQTHTQSLVFVPALRYAVASAVRKRGLLPWHGAQKNLLRDLRDDASQLLRPHASASARSLQRSFSHRARFGSTPGFVPAVWDGEARATGVP